MGVALESIQNICTEITHEVERTYESLSLHFIVHGVGKIRDAIALSEHEILSHPAASAAHAIIHKHSKGVRSSFLGMAIARENRMLGFKKYDHLLGIFNINKDNFKNEAEARIKIYHLTWHAIDLYEIRQDPAYRNKFKSGPMIPKRSPLNLSKANLQADVFSGILAKLRGDNNALNRISKKRGEESLLPKNDHRAEDFPSVIAMESCHFALNELTQSPPAKSEQLKTVRRISLEIGHTFDENNIKQWWNYSIPAQDMAWRGFKKEEILGAAVNTSEDPFTRSIGYLVQEVTKIDPTPAILLENRYNAFVHPDENLNLHHEMVDTIFTEAIQQGVEEASSRALLNAANKQNIRLTEGDILGWCAHALQDAAKAFERALLNGAPPEQAARMQFEGNPRHPKWEDLKDLGKTIVGQRRQGLAVTMGHIAEICHDNPTFAPVLDAIKITMNDPEYVQSLKASNDLAMQPNAPTAELAPQAPAPKGPAPNTPAPTAAPVMPAPIAAGPSLGGNNRAAQIARQRQLAAQKQKEEQDAQGSGDTQQT